MFKFFIPLLLLTSCSSTLYTGDGVRQLHISKHTNSEVVTMTREHEIQSMFYGTIPKGHSIKLGNDFIRRRSEYVSRVEVMEYETPLQQLIKFLSLGLFSKKTVKTKAVADMGENEYEVYE